MDEIGANFKGWLEVFFTDEEGRIIFDDFIRNKYKHSLKYCFLI